MAKLQDIVQQSHELNKYTRSITADIQEQTSKSIGALSAMPPVKISNIMPTEINKQLAQTNLVNIVQKNNSHVFELA